MSEANLRLVEDRPPSMPPPDPLVGRTLDGRYRIEAVLGEGGMGLVYRARHSTLNKPLAIKVLRPEVSRDAEVMERFKQEAQSASAIGNYHIIDISDFGVLPDGSTYFVMEFLDGIALTKVIEEQQPIAPLRTVRVGQQLCDALGAAHDRAIVHRDLKPDNIYLVKRGQDPDFVKVLDFGIAKVGGSSSKLTKAGQVFGTPHYMSPEQCAGKQVDARTDIYALGIILYEMCAGTVPFDADNLMGILTKHIYESPIAPRERAPLSDLPASLDAVIMKCLAKDVGDRYQSMAEVRADLALVEAEITGVAPGRPEPTGRVALARPSVQVATVAGLGPRRSRLLPIAAIVGIVSVLAVVGGVFALRSSQAASVTSSVSGLDTASGPADPAAPARDTPPSTGPLGASVGGDPSASGAGGGAGESTSVQGERAGDAPEGARAASEASPSVRIESDPPGAEVVIDGLVLGTTPLEVPRPQRGAEVTAVTLRMRGFRERALGISQFSPTTIQQTLERASSGGRRPGASGQGPTMAPDVAAGAAMTEPTPPTAMRPGAGDGLVDPWSGSVAPRGH